MKALKFDLLQNGTKALKSGCNLVLYCEPNPLKSLQLVRKLPYVDKFTQKKTSQFNWAKQKTLDEANQQTPVSTYWYGKNWININS